ncbi:MAG: hypothetical protein WC554_02720 [Clostridia bacterium]
MRKIHIIEAVIDWFDSDQAGEHRAKYHPEIIKTHLNDAFNQIVYATWLNGKKFSDFSQLDAWSRTYECTIVAQAGTNAYAYLPFAPIQLPDGMGIRQICDHDDNANVFAPIELTANVVFAELEVDAMDTTPTYRMEQNNLFAGAGEESHMLKLERMPLAPGLIASVDALLIVPMEQMDDYDDIVVPGMQEDTLVRQVIDLMVKKANPDTLNDNVIKTPVE